MTNKNELQDKIDDVGCAIYDSIAYEFDKATREHAFKTEHQYESYGDTEVEVAQFVDEDSETEFREEMEKNLNVDEAIEILKADSNFRDCLKELLDKIVWERPLDF